MSDDSEIVYRESGEGRWACNRSDVLVGTEEEPRVRGLLTQSEGCDRFAKECLFMKQQGLHLLLASVLVTKNVSAYIVRERYLFLLDAALEIMGYMSRDMAFVFWGVWISLFEGKDCELEGLR